VPAGTFTSSTCFEPRVKGFTWLDIDSLPTETSLLFKRVFMEMFIAMSFSETLLYLRSTSCFLLRHETKPEKRCSLPSWRE
jgi:hypothetical protein